MAVMTGLRRGELLGLLWPSVDLDAGQVTVSRQLLRLKVDQRWSLELVPSPRKLTGASANWPFLSEPVEALHKRASQPATGRPSSSRPVSWGSPLGHFVFATNAGTPLDPDNVTKRIKRALRRVGLDDRRPHDLRATFGSLLQDQHVDLKTISHLMRHSTIRLTADTYLDVMDQAGRDAAAILDRLLRGCLKSARPLASWWRVTPERGTTSVLCRRERPPHRPSTPGDRRSPRHPDPAPVGPEGWCQRLLAPPCEFSRICVATLTGTPRAIRTVGRE